MNDEEVWLAAYCASLTGQRSAISPAADNIASWAKLAADTARADADAALKAFRSAFFDMEISESLLRASLRESGVLPKKRRWPWSASNRLDDAVAEYLRREAAGKETPDDHPSEP